MQMNAKRAGATATGKKSRLSGGFIATALAVGMLLAGANGAAAQSTTPTTVTCQSQWNDSPASEYCTTSWLLQVGSTVADPSDADCDISATCSITFTHGTNGASSTTLTPSLSLAVFGMDDTDELDICVKEETDADGTVSYTAVLRTACRANEYTSVQTTTGQFHD